MAVRVITLPRANEDIDEQFYFIAQDNFDVAQCKKHP